MAIAAARDEVPFDRQNSVNYERDGCLRTRAAYGPFEFLRAGIIQSNSFFMYEADCVVDLRPGQMKR